MRHPSVPYEEIFFTAKFGFLSRSVWEKYFSSRSRTRNSEIWREFVERKFFVKHGSSRLTDVLVLGPKAITILEKEGREKVHAPGVSQITHDEWLAEIAVCLTRSRLIESFQTEQELKKRFFGWLKLDRFGKEAKIPDLLVEMSDGNFRTRVALELETSRKGFQRYCQALKSYSRYRSTGAIIFITDDLYIRKKIELAIENVLYQTSERPVGFSKLKDWLHDPAIAPIDMMSQIITFRELPKMIRELQKDSSTIHRHSVDE